VGLHVIVVEVVLHILISGVCRGRGVLFSRIGLQYILLLLKMKNTKKRKLDVNIYDLQILLCVYLHANNELSRKFGIMSMDLISVPSSRWFSESH
jgi:hypothetical protein